MDRRDTHFHDTCLLALFVDKFYLYAVWLHLTSDRSIGVF